MSSSPVAGELRVLDLTAAPVSASGVVVNEVPATQIAIGTYSIAVNGPKAEINIGLPQKGVQPVKLEVPLLKADFVYLEVCLDPMTGEVKAVLQKPVSTSTVDGGTVKEVRAGQRVQVSGPAPGSRPVNDECFGAIPILEGITPFSTLTATTDGPNHPGISEYGNGETVNDVWYTYTASGNGVLELSTCGSADFDTDLVVYNGTECGNLTNIVLGSEDDSVFCPGYTSWLRVPVVQGNQYLIRVGGFGSFGDQSRGTGNLSLTLGAVVAPANDDCANAQSLACNDSVPFDNTDATTDPTDPAFSCYFGGAAQGFGTVWYTFVATDTTALITTNQSVGGDTELAVYSGTCGALTEIGCSEDEGVGLLSEIDLSGLNVGQTYYVQVASYDPGSQGAYVLDLTCPSPSAALGRCCFNGGMCVETTEEDCFDNLNGDDWLEGATCASDPCPLPPANDDCGNAMPLGALPASVVFDNTGATDDIVAGEECGVLSGPYHNVWFSVVGTGTPIRATTCSIGTANPDTKISVFCAGCLNNQCVTGNDDNCPASTFLSTITWCSEAGQTYYITVGDFSPTSGTGQIQLNVFSGPSSCIPSVECVQKGACCLDDGTCIIETEFHCTNFLGGEYQGDDTDCVKNAFADGGFEDGPFGGSWSEGSSTFGTPICDVAGCGTGGVTPVPPFDGAYWCWFGGIASGIVEVGFVEDTVTVRSDTLEFYLDIPSSSGNGADFMTVSIDGNLIFSVLEGDTTYTAPGWQRVALDMSAYNDGGNHTVRFDSTTFGTGVTNFWVDEVSIDAGLVCEECVLLDFQTEDDFITPLVNGQSISTPPEFGNLVSISASTVSFGPAIFDTNPVGPNLPLNNDPDLLVDKGNILIFQENNSQTIPGIFNDPDDSSAGGTFFFDFAQEVEMQSLVLVDIDVYPLPQDAYVTLIDSSARTRVYHAPSGFTEDISIDGGLGWRTLDLTTLAAQPGFSAVATASEDAGFDPKAVVRMEVHLTSSGGVDDIEFCY